MAVRSSRVRVAHAAGVKGSNMVWTLVKASSSSGGSRRRKAMVEGTDPGPHNTSEADGGEGDAAEEVDVEMEDEMDEGLEEAAIMSPEPALTEAAAAEDSTQTSC